MDLGLKGKKAIVTGGSRGIARTICELLAEGGCDLALCARGKAGVDEAVTALAGKGVRAHGGIVDVADRNSLRAWIVDAVEQLGGIDILVANVSAFGMAMDEDTWRRSFEIDVMGTVAGVEDAIRHLEWVASCGSSGYVNGRGATSHEARPRSPRKRNRAGTSWVAAFRNAPPVLWSTNNMNGLRALSR
jgi:NAD(P)-dependent dehydrogenase (short-subunit alcohol dehydrogenase family)